MPDKKYYSWKQIHQMSSNLADAVESKYFTHIILTEEQSKGEGPNTNLDKNIRSMRVGDKTITLPWKNHTRPNAYELSPFDQTILIDSEYYVFDDT